MNDIRRRRRHADASGNRHAPAPRRETPTNTPGDGVDSKHSVILAQEWQNEKAGSGLAHCAVSGVLHRQHAANTLGVLSANPEVDGYGGDWAVPPSGITKRWVALMRPNEDRWRHGEHLRVCPGHDISVNSQQPTRPVRRQFELPVSRQRGPRPSRKRELGDGCCRESSGRQRGPGRLQRRRSPRHLSLARHPRGCATNPG